MPLQNLLFCLLLSLAYFGEVKGSCEAGRAVLNTLGCDIPSREEYNLKVAESEKFQLRASDFEKLYIKALADGKSSDEANKILVQAAIKKAEEFIEMKKFCQDMNKTNIELNGTIQYYRAELTQTRLQLDESKLREKKAQEEIRTATTSLTHTQTSLQTCLISLNHSNIQVKATTSNLHLKDSVLNGTLLRLEQCHVNQTECKKEKSIMVDHYQSQSRECKFLCYSGLMLLIIILLNALNTTSGRQLISSLFTSSPPSTDSTPSEKVIEALQTELKTKNALISQLEEKEKNRDAEEERHNKARAEKKEMKEKELAKTKAQEEMNRQISERKKKEEEEEARLKQYREERKNPKSTNLPFSHQPSRKPNTQTQKINKPETKQEREDKEIQSRNQNLLSLQKATTTAEKPKQVVATPTKLSKEDIEIQNRNQKLAEVQKGTQFQTPKLPKQTSVAPAIDNVLPSAVPVLKMEDDAELKALALEMKREGYSQSEIKDNLKMLWDGKMEKIKEDQEIERKNIILRERMLLYKFAEKTVIPADGNCQFSALSDQIYGDIGCHELLRSEAVEWIQKNKDTRLSNDSCIRDYIEIPVEDYCSEMSRHGVWGDHITLIAIAESYGREIIILTSAGSSDDCISSIKPTHIREKEPLYLFHRAEKHYGSLSLL